MRSFKVALALVGLFLFSWAPARADTVYDWTLSWISGTSTPVGNSSGTLSGSGTITVGSTQNGNGGYYATAIDGSLTSPSPSLYSGSITSLFGPNGAVDDAIYYDPASGPTNGGFVLDDSGLAFTLSNNQLIEIGPNNSTPGEYNVGIPGSPTGYDLVSFSLTPESVSATPLPPTWVMFIAGLGLLGFISFRQSQRHALNAA